MNQNDLFHENPDFDTFSETVKKAMEEEFGEGYTFTVKQQLNNNSTHRTGLAVVKEGCLVSPMVYLDDFYRRYLHTRDFKAITTELAECCRKAFTDRFDT